MKTSSLILSFLALAPLRAALAADAPCPLSTPGLVVEAIAPESAAFRAGLMPGDRLVSWCRIPDGAEGCAARGDLRNPFDWLDLQMEDIQRGGVVVEGTRGSESHLWSLLPTFQILTVAPLFRGALAEAYQISRSRERAGDSGSAAKDLERAAQLADESSCTDAALWLRLRVAQLHARAWQWPEADAEYQSLLANAHASGAARLEAHLQMSWSETLEARGDFIRARQQLEKALELEEKGHPEGLGVATVLLRLGNLADKQDGLEEADRLYRRGYDLILRLAPNGGAEAAAVSNLAMSTGKRGDLAQAEVYAARALALWEKLTPSGSAIIPSLLSYGNAIYARGDFAGAEAAFLRAKRILEKFQPESIILAKTLHNLGEIAHQRGDDDAAESLFRRELSLFERLDPSGKLMRDTLIGLGGVALQRHQSDQAEAAWQHALSISEELNPQGTDTAWCLVGLAETARLRKREAEAEKLLERALAIWQQINPEAVDAGVIHLKLGILRLERGQIEAAEAHVRAAIRIQEKNHVIVSEGYQALARLQERKGQRQEAATSYLAAVDALETQRTRLGGAQESRWLFGSSLGDLHFEAAEHQIALAQPQAAWQLLERGRAWGFRELLAQRDLRFAREIPAELYAERHRLNAEYDRVQADLAHWTSAQGPDKRAALEGRLRDLRLEQTEVQKRIQQSSPHTAALESSHPLDLAATRSVLDPGTVLLEYAVGTERTWLFVVQSMDVPGPGLSVFLIPAGGKTLRTEVERWRNLLKRPGSDCAALRTRAQHLYHLLVRPAAGKIARARRILVSPDGPLHALPFAALRRGNQYLVEWKPIHSVLSATVYAELRGSHPARRNLQEARLDAFGAPLYPRLAPGKLADPEVRKARGGVDPGTSPLHPQGSRSDRLPLSQKPCLSRPGGHRGEGQIARDGFGPHPLRLPRPARRALPAQFRPGADPARASRRRPGKRSPPGLGDLREHAPRRRPGDPLGLRHGAGQGDGGRRARRPHPRLPVRGRPFRPRLALGRRRLLHRPLHGTLLSLSPRRQIQG